MDGRPGTYALILFSDTERWIRVGRLGRIWVPRGFLVYTGSALGSGGVRGRVGYHQRVGKRPRWHIDYLREQIPLEEVWYSYDEERREHAWAEALRRQPDAAPVPGFGASDCRCESHLYARPARPSWRGFRHQLRVLCPTHPLIHRRLLREDEPASPAGR